MSDKIILYHGSFCIVQKPDLSRCAAGKDFGQGFYLTTSKIQAQKFVATSIKKAVTQKFLTTQPSKGYVNAFEYTPSDNLSLYEFKNADISWLHCVVAHQKQGCIPGEFEKWNGYDLICGKIANDQTNTVIAAFLDGVYGPIDSVRTAELAISFLEPENLTKQWCFRSTKALGYLKFLSAEEVHLHGK